MNRSHPLLALFVGLLLAGGCDGLDSPEENQGEWHVERGTIVFFGDTSAVEFAADTVRVGQSLRVTATTFGDGCTEKAGMLAEVQGLRAVLTPLDSVFIPPDKACSDELKELSHSAEVAFETAGEARVIIRGIGRGSSGNDSEEVELERTVVVVE